MNVEEVNGWRDMHTAPKDGTVVLLYFRPGFIRTGAWAGVRLPGWRDSGGYGGKFIGKPTHWMPLPAGPRSPA